MMKQFPQKHPIPHPLLKQNLEFHFSIFSTPWGTPEATQIAFDEIEQYLTASLQDSEVTSPFERFEFFDKETNELRISTLLANEKIYRTLNRDEYSSACEITTIFLKNHRLYYSSCGGHEILIKRKNRLYPVTSHSDANHFGFPEMMLGLYKQCLPRSGSLLLDSQDLIFIQSSSGFLFDEKSYQKNFQSETPRSDIKKGMWLSLVSIPPFQGHETE